MNRLLSIAASCLLLILSFASHALTLSPLPGSANQATLASAFFPNTIGVKATDETGQPVAGARVTFSALPFDGTNGFVFFAGEGFSFSNAVEAVTGGDGVALALPGAIGFEPGPTGVTATADHASPVTMPLTVLAGGTARIEVISGSHQVAPVGFTFAQPWVAQAFDAAGSAVPNAAILFHCPQESGARGASCAFEGAHDAWVRADANGIAVSAFVKATSAPGHDEGVASTLNPLAPASAAFFAFVTLPSQAGIRCEKDKGPSCGP